LNGQLPDFGAEFAISPPLRDLPAAVQPRGEIIAIRADFLRHNVMVKKHLHNLDRRSTGPGQMWVPQGATR